MKWKLRQFTNQQFQMSKHLISCCNFCVQLIQEPSNKLDQLHSLSEHKRNFNILSLVNFILSFQMKEYLLFLLLIFQEFVTFQNPKHKKNQFNKMNLCQLSNMNLFHNFNKMKNNTKKSWNQWNEMKEKRKKKYRDFWVSGCSK
jgi:hypothetical protein